MLRDSKDYVNQTLMGGLSGFESPIGWTVSTASRR